MISVKFKTIIVFGLLCSAYASVEYDESADNSTTPNSVPSQKPTTGGTIISTTLPNVTFNYNTFSIKTCDTKTCIYQFDTPINDQKFLASEQSAISEDVQEYTNLSSENDQRNGIALKTNDNAIQKILDLQNLLDQIENELNSISNLIADINQAQVNTAQFLYEVEIYIDSVSDQNANCFTTTPLPTTTTTSPPTTTTADPCDGFECADESSKCEVDANNIPYCNNCYGNLDGYQRCASVKCDLNGTPFVFPNDTQPADYYTNGYNALDPDLSVIPAGSNCTYFLEGNGFDATNINLTCLNDNTSLIVSSEGNQYVLRSAMTSRAVKSIFKTAVNPTLAFTASQSQEGFCRISLQRIDNERNGFFSWLMGY